jgi:hypothetical protein
MHGMTWMIKDGMTWMIKDGMTWMIEGERGSG